MSNSLCRSPSSFNFRYPHLQCVVLFVNVFSKEFACFVEVFRAFSFSLTYHTLTFIFNVYLTKLIQILVFFFLLCDLLLLEKFVTSLFPLCHLF